MKNAKATPITAGSAIVGLLASVLLGSCEQKVSYTLDAVHEFPIDIGCSCSFAESEKNFKNSNYIFGSDFDSVAYVSVNNQIVKLKLTGTNRNDTLNDNRTDTFSNAEYKVIIKPKKINSSWEETETIRYEGRIRIENKSGETIERKFVGECGC
jgi:hypothetical protein